MSIASGATAISAPSRSVIAGWSCFSIGPARSSGPPLVARRRSSSRRLELVREGILVGARHVADAASRSPEAYLMIERDDRRVVDRNLGRTLQQRFAPGIVDRNERVLQHQVQLGIGVMSTVRRAETLVSVDRRDQRLERARRLARARAPADKDETEFEFGSLGTERR